jgi:hypothetical protein
MGLTCAGNSIGVLPFRPSSPVPAPRSRWLTADRRGGWRRRWWRVTEQRRKLGHLRGGQPALHARRPHAGGCPQLPLRDRAGELPQRIGAEAAPVAGDMPERGDRHGSWSGRSPEHRVRRRRARAGGQTSAVGWEGGRAGLSARAAHARFAALYRYRESKSTQARCLAQLAGNGGRPLHRRWKPPGRRVLP